MKTKKRVRSLSTVIIRNEAGEFAENKDTAADLREQIVAPQLKQGLRVIIDFTGVLGATQSFVHALIADPIRKNGPQVVDLISFKGCNEIVKGIIGIVVEYSQMDVDADIADMRSAQR